MNTDEPNTGFGKLSAAELKALAEGIRLDILSEDTPTTGVRYAVLQVAGFMLKLLAERDGTPAQEINNGQ